MPLNNIGMIQNPMGSSTPNVPATYVGLEKESYARGQASDARELKMWGDMLSKPQMAPAIAKAYGMEFTPEMEQMLAHPKQTAQAVEAAKIWKDMGGKNPEAARTFIKSMMQNGGDFNASIESLKGMQMGGASATAPHTGGLPKGYMWGPGGSAVPIPGITQDMYKGEKNYALPVSAADKLMDSSNEGVLMKRLRMDYPEDAADGEADIDPSAFQSIQQQVMKNMQDSGDFEQAYESAIQHETGGAGLEYSDPGMFSSEVYRLPQGAAPASAPTMPPAPPATAGAQGVMAPKNAQEFANMPSGARFKAPDGSIRTKK